LDVFAFRNFKEGGGKSQKLHPRYHTHLAARTVAKFHEATPSGSKVLAANTLHFEPILVILYRVYKFGGAAPPGGRNMAFQKSQFEWVNTSRVISGVQPNFFVQRGINRT